MQVFKSKIFKRVYSLVTLVIIFTICYELVTACLEKVTYATYFNKEIEEIIENDETVDLLFVGTSRLYHSMIPSVFEKKLGCDNVLVAATATQPMCGTYYYLKDLVETVHPKKVIINVTFDVMLNEATIQPCLLVYDRLSVKNRIPFVWNCIDNKEWKYILGPCRYRDNLRSYDEIQAEKQEIRERGSDMYDSEEDYYAEKGFVYSYSDYETGMIPFEYGVSFTFSKDKVLEENVYYLDKCIDLCQKNDIEVSLVTAPCATVYMYIVKGYDEATQWYKSYAKEKGITYYNLNYLKDREKFLPDEMMYDTTHTNGEGAKVISEIYGEILLKEQKGENVSSMFYSNFEELSKEINRVVAVSAKVSFTEIMGEAAKANIAIESHQNEDITPLYQVEIVYEDGTKEILVDWTSDKEREILLPTKGGFTLKVRAKGNIDGAAEALQCYSF